MLAASLGRLRWESDATLSAEQRLPVSVWTYGFDDDGVRHLGPMAQDFAAAFALGDDDRVIDMVDATGWYGRLQALHGRVVALEAEVPALRGPVHE
ncbi:MAG: hypothetical protein M3R01_13575 [Actinomycetota bacterium]|nr:hypothetical protein [Actinomycetota bacterium]